jgi:hypothetical protein
MARSGRKNRALTAAARFSGRGPDAGQISRDALVEAHDARRQLVDRGDQSEPDGRHDQRVLDEVLPLFIPKKLNH